MGFWISAFEEMDVAEDLGGREKQKPPGSHIWGLWLRERLDNSNYVLLKIPIEIHNLGHGQRLICMDSERLPEELGLNEEAIGSLVQGGLVRLRPQKPRPKKRIDYEALQQTYRRMLAEGGFASQTELARHLGVSRVWVSIVLRGNRRNEID